MQKWGLTVNDTDKICFIGGGCFIRKSDKETFFNMLKKFNDETKAAIDADKPATVLSMICFITNSQTTNTASHTNMTKLLTHLD